MSYGWDCALYREYTLIFSGLKLYYQNKFKISIENRRKENKEEREENRKTELEGL